MPGWITYLIAAAVLALAAPLLAWAGRRYSRRAKGAFMLAGVLLGVGEPVDPPSKHLIEANTGEERESPAPGDPPSV